MRLLRILKACFLSDIALLCALRLNPGLYVVSQEIRETLFRKDRSLVVGKEENWTSSLE